MYLTSLANVRPLRSVCLDHVQALHMDLIDAVMVAPNLKIARVQGFSSSGPVTGAVTPLFCRSRTLVGHLVPSQFRPLDGRWKKKMVPSPYACTTSAGEG